MAAESSDILTSEQKQFLDVVAAEPSLCRKFYFTGGTPLTAFYLSHRLSEDLDLFSEEEVQLLPIRAFIKRAQKKLAIEKIDYRQFLGLHTFELFFSKDNVLKIDFNYYPFPRIEKGLLYKKTLQIDSILDIAVNKVHTVAMKPRARDFIDLFFIVREKGYAFYDLLMKAKIKFDWHIDPIQLGSRLLEASEMADYPRMLKPIKHEEWKSFFIEEGRKLKDEIFN
jgi:predicted nucleotidyltransferase component of viral defense system